MSRHELKAVDAERRVLVLVRGQHEGRLTVDLLGRAGFDAKCCGDVAELCRDASGGGAAALLAEEMLTARAVEELRNWLSQQPPWSDFPLVVFGAGPSADEARAEGLSALGNVTFLDRPVRVRSMLASVRAALRSRKRQYEARRAIESRDEFLAMLGHELRNPLGAIAFATSVLDQKIPQESRPKEHAVIERQARHLSRLVDDLLDVARITHGKVELRPEKLDLVEVVKGAFELVEGRARAQRLAFEFHPPQGSVFVDGDKQRLEQVFSNLLTNAIKYTPNGGSVGVQVSFENGYATALVSDNGVGLAADMRERIFEPFAQVGASLDRSQGGLGLGLALVRSIVLLHGGSVEVASDGLGHGSRFTVRLPRRLDDVASTPCASEPPPSRTRKKVLVVEDNEDIRELFAQLLLQAGHEVACAEDGPHGLDQVASFAPDIAFVDVGLPGFDGLELARRVRASGNRVYLIAMTGYGQAEDKKRSADAGFDDHLVKPALDVDVERAISRASARSS